MTICTSWSPPQEAAAEALVAERERRLAAIAGRASAPGVTEKRGSIANQRFLIS
jgi:hypothetical protein